MMPLLLMQGEEDRVTPAAANAELLARAVPDATLVMLPRCGHLPEVEAPARVNELIEQHLCAGSRPELARNCQFESIPLQRRVCKPSVPQCFAHPLPCGLGKTSSAPAR